MTSENNDHRTTEQKRAAMPLISHASNVAGKRLKYHADRICAAPIAASSVVPAIAIAAFVVACKVAEAALTGITDTHLGRFEKPKQ